MADELKEPEPRPAEIYAGRSLARIQAMPWLLFIGMVALAAWLGWKAFGTENTGDPLATSLIAFEKQNSLTVFAAQLAPVVASDDERFFGTIKSRQIAVIPAQVEYRLDLSGMDASRMSWDRPSETLTVTLPELEVGKPNLDEARAQYLREGIWISREAQDKLTRDNTRLAERIALEQAENPVLIGLARTAAKDAIRQNLAIPLAVAGFGDVTVNVRFEEEIDSPQQLDGNLPR